ncbi:MAG TPA: class I SAM-dependent rRNA methyltransferase [Candidatus Binatia bacterium]|jgi:23S rRNA (cytosine1962-C5)-methyltransferase|nr:class I SAM-dependent rRNA methyltransferase [Candidatus Binatia bacterium]
MYPIVTLSPGKETNGIFRHPWIFSGALVKRPEGIEHGAIVRVADSTGRIIGTGTYSAKSSIAVRLLAFGDKEVVIDEAWFAAKFIEADERRRLLGYGPDSPVDGYRAAFGEADGLPGLVIDRYGDVIVLQISTTGMDARREEIVAALKSAFSPTAIVERSDLPVRKEEALGDAAGTLFGEAPASAAFSERGMRFEADVVNGQKTGFFLDQKELRAAIGRYADGRETLNLFSYTGAAGIAAMKGGATSVHNVDASATALEGCRRHAELNGIDASAFTTEEADAFQYLSSKGEPAYDMVLMDPPALIKSQRDGEEGKKAYHFLNRAALRLVRDGGVFVTSSCSHFLNEEDFAFTLRRASVQAGVRLDLLEIVRQAPDHPLSVYFPESSYLKSFVFRVARES